MEVDDHAREESEGNGGGGGEEGEATDGLKVFKGGESQASDTIEFSFEEPGLDEVHNGHGHAEGDEHDSNEEGDTVDPMDEAG